MRFLLCFLFASVALGESRSVTYDPATKIVAPSGLVVTNLSTPTVPTSDFGVVNRIYLSTNSSFAKNPSQYGAVGLAWPGVSLIDQTVDSTMSPRDGATTGFNWVNQSWSGFAINSGKLRLIEQASSSSSVQCYLQGILFDASRISGSGGLLGGRSYTIRLKVRLVSGTAHDLFVGFGRSASTQYVLVPASKITSTEREFRGVVTVPTSQGVAMYLGMLNGSNAAGTVYDVDDVELCEGAEEFGTEITSITRSSTTATVTTATAHGFATGDTAIISGVIGADQATYNGGQSVVVTGTTTFTYTMTAAPSASAVLGFARVLPDDTTELQAMFLAAKGLPVHWPPNRSYHVSDTIDASVSSGIDLNNGRLAFHLRGDKRGLMAGRVENGTVEVLFGTGAVDADVSIQSPVSSGNITAIQGFQPNLFRNLRIGGLSDRTTGSGCYGLILASPWGATVENVSIISGNTLARGVWWHWSKVNQDTVGVYPPRNITVRNVRVPSLGYTGGADVALYGSSGSGVIVENVDIGSVTSAIYIAAGDAADGMDSTTTTNKFRAPMVFRNIWARDLAGQAVIINQKTISDTGVVFASGNVTNGSFVIGNVTNALLRFHPGERIFGTGIRYGTVVQSVGTNSLTLSNRGNVTGVDVRLDKIAEFPILIEDSRFVGQQASSGNNNGVDLYDDGNVTFNRVAFDNFKYGAKLTGPGDGSAVASARNITFRDCTFSRSLLDGVIIRGARGVTFDGCRFFSNGQQTANTYQQLKFDGTSGGTLPDIDGAIVKNCTFGILGMTETAKWAVEVTYTMRTRHIQLFNNNVLANGSTGEVFTWTVAGANSGQDTVDIVRDNFVHPTLNITDPYNGLLFLPSGYDVSGIGPRRTFVARTTADPALGTWNIGDSARIIGVSTNGSRNGWIINTSGTGGFDPAATATTTIGSPWVLTTDGTLYAVGQYLQVLGGNAGGQIKEIDGNWIKLPLNSSASVAGVTPAMTAFLVSNASYVQGSAPSGGTVTNVSVTAANGVSGTVANPTTTPAITIELGAITPSSVNGVAVSGSGSVANSGTSSLSAFTGSGSSSGSNTGDQTGVTGNAGTATRLATGRTIAMTGDMTWTLPSFDGSADVTAVGTLPNSGVTAATYGSATQSAVIALDAKGRATTASNVVITPAVGNISGLGTGVATLLGGSSSGTGGPAGTASPTFTGTANFSAATASADVTAGATSEFKVNGRSRFGAYADGAMYVFNSAGTQSASLRQAAPVSTKATTYTATVTESGTTFNNSGATSLATITLPTGFIGLWYKFDCRDTDGIKILASGSDNIRIAGTSSAAAGYVQSTIFGSVVTLEWDGSDWRATSAVGTWVMDGTTTLRFTGTVTSGISGNLVAGVLVVANSSITANTRVFLTTHVRGTITLPVAYDAATRSPGVSFTITSSNVADTSTVEYMLVEP